MPKLNPRANTLRQKNISIFNSKLIPLTFTLCDFHYLQICRDADTRTKEKKRETDGNGRRAMGFVVKEEIITRMIPLPRLSKHYTYISNKKCD